MHFAVGSGISVFDVNFFMQPASSVLLKWTSETFNTLTEMSVLVLDL
jgi:hypothetical protein